MKISRRSALGLLSLGGATLSYGYPGWAHSTSKKHGTHAEPARPLAIPALDSGVVKNGVRNFDLNMQKGVSQFFDGQDTLTYGINGTYLAPTLKMRDGETVRMNVKNNIGRASTLHWHGMHLPARMDGGPHQVVENGASWSPEFEVKQNASTFWYHSHMVPETGFQVYHGLAGMIVVEDERAGNLGLPDTYGVDDIPLVLQDRRFGPEGNFEYLTSMPDRVHGMKGGTLLVNGTVNPYFEARSDTLRFRILNGSNSRFYTLAFSDKRRFQQIASDGGLLETPYETNNITLGPAERAEIIVDVSDGKPVMLQSTTPDQDGGGGMSGGGMMMGDMVSDFDVLEIRPDQNRSKAMIIPPRLMTLAVPDPQVAVKTRTFTLGMGMGMGMMMGLSQEMTINNKAMKLDRIDVVARVGTSEVWVIDNPTPMPHPIHIHDVQFRILDRDGKPPHAGERGLKDTVVVNSRERVRVLLNFTDYTDPDRPYMYHCHILEHEDAGMMGQFTVV